MHRKIQVHIGDLSFSPLFYPHLIDSIHISLSLFFLMSSACGGLFLDSFLITPVQRIPRYLLLLQEILKKTPDTHPDHEGLKLAVKDMAAVATQVHFERARCFVNCFFSCFFFHYYYSGTYYHYYCYLILSF